MEVIMPTYDYKCLDCNYTFEKFQKMSDEQLKVCPNCNGKLKRLIGAGGEPIFKGSGFYQTDYKNKSGKESLDKPTTKVEKKTSAVNKDTNTSTKIKKD